MMSTILVVDDSPSIVNIVTSMLKQRGYRTIAAYGGEECLEVIRKEVPDLILLDVMMEPVDGWETLMRIKADDRTRETPVLMLTAKELTPEEKLKYGQYIVDLVIKPMTHRDLYNALDKVFSRK
jgi:two-component system, OmpR family, response regulator